MLAPRATILFDEINTRKKSTRIIASNVDCIQIHRACWSFGLRLKLYVCVRVWFWLKSYVACFIIQSKLQN